MTVQTRAICYFFPPRSSAWCWSSRTPRHYKSNREQSCRDHFPPLRNHDSLENSLHHSSACCCISWDGNQSVLNCEHYSLAFTSLDKGIGGGIFSHHPHSHTRLLTDLQPSPCRSSVGGACTRWTKADAPGLFISYPGQNCCTICRASPRFPTLGLQHQ